jgi:hypothetical protein
MSIELNRFYTLNLLLSQISIFLSHCLSIQSQYNNHIYEIDVPGFSLTETISTLLIVSLLEDLGCLYL